MLDSDGKLLVIPDIVPDMVGRHVTVCPKHRSSNPIVLRYETGLEVPVGP